MNLRTRSLTFVVRVVDGVEIENRSRVQREALYCKGKLRIRLTCQVASGVK